MTLTVFSINGFMGDMWTGPQADTGRFLSANHLAYWQPCGYNSSGFPLSKGVNSGLPELRRQIDLHPGPFVMSSWSLGSIIAVEWYKQALAGGPQADRIPDFKGPQLLVTPIVRREVTHQRQVLAQCPTLVGRGSAVLPTT